MRELRLVLEGEVALYAISNEIALHLPDLTSEKQSLLTGLMEMAGEFCGVETLCWHVTPRGYGALVRVDPPGEVEDEVLGARVALWYGEEAAAALVAAKGRGQTAFASLCAEYRRKMHLIREYASLFQRRFSMQLNRHRGRLGPVWRQRFRSYLLEDTSEVRIRFAGYLHTRPYGDPDTGVFSSLFKADSGDKAWRKRYRELTGKRRWDAARDCLGEAMTEMSAHSVRPSCGVMDSQKVEAARRRSREMQKKAVFTEAAWVGFYDAYQQFVTANGSHRFPENAPHYDGLRHWVRMQRIYLSRGTIGVRRRQLLEAISFPAKVNGKRTGASARAK